MAAPMISLRHALQSYVNTHVLLHGILQQCMITQGVRKHLPADWRKRLQAIQAALATETRNLPPDVGQDDSMSYFAAKAIRDKLAGSADKTLFGGLKGSAGSWDKIVKAYEKQSKPSTTAMQPIALQSAPYNRLSMLNSRFQPF